MRTSKFRFLVLAAVLIGAGIATAQDSRLAKEFYLKVGVSSTTLEEDSSDTLIAGGSYEFAFDETDAFGYELGVGMTFFNFLRTELTYGQNSYSYELGFGPSGIPVVPGKTDVDTTLLMLDLNLEFSGLGLTPDWLRPYIGFGIGYAWHDMEDISFVNPTWLTEGDENAERTWRVSVGVGLKLSPHLILDVNYSWVDAGVANSGTYFQGAPTSLSEPVEISMKAERLAAGLRFIF